MADDDKVTPPDGKSTQKKRRKGPSSTRRTRFLALEPRIVFDAALGSELVEKSAQNAVPDDAGKSSQGVPQSPPSLDWLRSPATQTFMATPAAAPVEADTKALDSGAVARDPGALQSVRVTDADASKLTRDPAAPGASGPVRLAEWLSQSRESQTNKSAAAEPTESPDASIAERTESSGTDQARNEIVFIDTSVEDYQDLLAGVNPEAKVVLLDATRDGVDQMLEYLAAENNVDAIHIVSHGDAGRLELGTTRLDDASIRNNYAEKLVQLGRYLSADADILVYGCDFGKGEDGAQAAMRLALLTGADVAASDDLTGSAALGGDWDLERQFGTIETSVAFGERAQRTFSHVLATLDWDAVSWTGAGGSANEIINTYAVGSGNVRVTVQDTGLDLATLALNQSNTGGLSPAQNSLYMYADFESQTAIGDEKVVVLLDFSHKGGVANLSFSIFDIDGSGFTDRIVVTATDQTGTITPTNIALTGGGTTSQSSSIVTGTGSSGSSSNAGNATFTFSGSTITQVRIEYQSGFTVGSDPSAQAISFHDVTFSEAPLLDLNSTTADSYAGDDFEDGKDYTGGTTGADIAWSNDWQETDAGGGRRYRGAGSSHHHQHRRRNSLQQLRRGQRHYAKGRFVQLRSGGRVHWTYFVVCVSGHDSRRFR